MRFVFVGVVSLFWSTYCTPLPYLNSYSNTLTWVDELNFVRFCDADTYLSYANTQAQRAIAAQSVVFPEEKVMQEVSGAGENEGEREGEKRVNISPT